ncbi:hypothetical protein P3T76_007121 [Phytophthora citrophthora]|uniref:RxLR effector protein n=1 Tax=Phytophthora citrophthora TaxID=4793 RepID=A0AAD9LLN5_9STRA|nr:hypothetical protein P3T76_007121 [Phytophthora citrophthora]
MRLTFIVLVAVAFIFACCEGASAITDSSGVADRVQSRTNNNNRFLRVHQDAEEERAPPQLVKSLSEKFLTKAFSQLTRSKSLNQLDDVASLKAGPGRAGKTLSEVLKLDEVAYLKAKGVPLSELSKLDDIASLNKINADNHAIFLRIENKGFNPDTMLKTMIQRGKEHIDYVLLKHYTEYWMSKYPTWSSSL